MRGYRFGYVVQLDLPGGPIKIGQSGSPRTRLQSFSTATPCDARIVGITFNGVEREREMLAATETSKIKGEWRYPTRELRSLIAKYHNAGEWFSPVDDYLAHMEQAKVEDRVRKIIPNLKHRICGQSLGLHWANALLMRVTEVDPMLPVDWAGFVPAHECPSLFWPIDQKQAA